MPLYNLFEAFNYVQAIANELKCKRENTEYKFRQLYIPRKKQAEPKILLWKHHVIPLITKNNLEQNFFILFLDK